jgi:hypothetical protein
MLIDNLPIGSNRILENNKSFLEYFITGNIYIHENPFLFIIVHGCDKIVMNKTFIVINHALIPTMKR